MEPCIHARQKGLGARLLRFGRPALEEMKINSLKSPGVASAQAMVAGVAWHIYPRGS